MTDDSITTQGDDRIHCVRVDMFEPFFDDPGIGYIISHVPAVCFGDLVKKPPQQGFIIKFQGPNNDFLAFLEYTFFGVPH
jgi:hypothetical protein